MTTLLAALLLVAAAALAAICSGAETGFYAFSRLRHRLGLERSEASSRRLERLFARPNRLLATLLLGLTLALELVTFCNHVLLESFPSLSASARATVGTLVTAPLLFVFSEALPKQAFLTRPYVLLQRCSWALDLLSRLLAPLSALVARLSALVEEVVPGGAHSAAPAPESGVEHALLAGLSEGLLTRSEHLLAANVLELGRLTVEDLSVPVDQLPHLQQGASATAWAAVLRDRGETRALVVDPASGAPVGMVHALDLALAIEDGRSDAGELVRPLPAIDAGLTVATALGRLHEEGLTLALVSRGRGRPPALLRIHDVVSELFRAAPAPAVLPMERAKA